MKGVPDGTRTQSDLSPFRSENADRLDPDRRDRSRPVDEYSPWNVALLPILPAGSSPILPLSGGQQRTNRADHWIPAVSSTSSPIFQRWKPDASLEEISNIYRGLGYKNIEVIDRSLSDSSKSDRQRLTLLISKAILFNYEGEPNRAYEVLEQTRSWVEKSRKLAEEGLYTLIYFEGVTALRRGENDNCIMCRGEKSCILPLGSRRRPHQSRRFPPGDPSFYRVPRAVPR